MTLPLISGRECIKTLGKFGYVLVRTRGSHARLECAGRTPVSVPLHDELDRNTLPSILKTVNLSEEEFRALL
jgi:predicted RNA binding protein YcfA (HicA-like mRNA interferase family)